MCLTVKVNGDKSTTLIYFPTNPNPRQHVSVSVRLPLKVYKVGTMSVLLISIYTHRHTSIHARAHTHTRINDYTKIDMRYAFKITFPTNKNNKCIFNLGTAYYNFLSIHIAQSFSIFQSLSLSHTHMCV